MTERPILFSSSMVRAILAHRDPKTVTRRAVKFPPSLVARGIQHDIICYSPGGPRWREYEAQLAAKDPEAWSFDAWAPGVCVPCEDGTCQSILCPYGAAGDKLWCRETWSPDHRNVYPCPDIVYRADNSVDDPIECRCSWDLQRKGEHDGDCLVGVGFKWRPSIFMPKRHARLWLDVVSIRVERLHEITAAEVLREGVRLTCNREGTPVTRITGKFPPTDYLPKGRGGRYTVDELLVAEYASLWDAINSKRFPWASNPLVYRIEFARVQW